MRNVWAVLSRRPGDDLSSARHGQVIEVGQSNSYDSVQSSSTPRWRVTIVKFNCETFFVRGPLMPSPIFVFHVISVHIPFDAFNANFI